MNASAVEHLLRESDGVAIGDAIARGETTSAAIVDGCLARIARLNPLLNAFVSVDEAAVRAQAQASDILTKAGLRRSRLHGVPVAIKDLIDVAGQKTGAGAKSRDAMPAAGKNAECVDRLIDAGMICLGKTHTVEFAFGATGANPMLGTPLNPWDAEHHRMPGGSSSGSGVAVSARMVPMALGTDTAGSVRNPAVWCGIVGHKTSFGAVSCEGVVPFASSFDSVGALTTSVRDAALLCDLLEGRAMETRRRRAVRLDQGVADLRLGVFHRGQFPSLDPVISERFDLVTKSLEGRGASIVPFETPRSLKDYSIAAGGILAAEAYAANCNAADDPRSPMNDFIRRRILDGRNVSAADLMKLHRQRTEDTATFLDAMEGLDALLLPGLSLLAPRIADVDETTFPLNVHCRFVNWLGLATVAVPIGLSPDGLPVGVQIVSRNSADAMAIRIGAEVERLFPPLTPVPDWA